jgi:hypothetical protein
MLSSALECADKELKTSEKVVNGDVVLTVTSAAAPNGVTLECTGDDSSDDDSDEEEPSKDLHDVISE